MTVRGSVPLVFLLTLVVLSIASADQAVSCPRADDKSATVVKVDVKYQFKHRATNTVRELLSKEAGAIVQDGRLHVRCRGRGHEARYLVDGLPVSDPFVAPIQPMKTVTAFGLEQCGPNPFAERTTLQYALPRADRLVVEVYDVSGRRLQVLKDEGVPAGHITIPWSGGAERLAAGIHFVRAAFGAEVVTQKLVLIR